MTDNRDRWLLRREAAKYLGLSVSALAHMACSGLGPQYYRAGKFTRYRLSDLDEWARYRPVKTLPSHMQGWMHRRWSWGY